MKNGFVIFLAAFAVLLASWSAFVLGPQLQLGGAKQVPVLNSSEVYPHTCLLYTSPSPRDGLLSRMPSSA